MLYAIVDIETTGSYAAANGITEIGIVIHDGKEVINFYETLVNPQISIPYFIQKLTGINDEMVANAPTFEEIAGQVYELLQDKIFVAHNVNFDYSFVKYQLDKCGYELNTKKLCTVRLSRKVLPGLPGYSLGKLTQHLGITHTMHHRAGGDALATADLLALIIKNDSRSEIRKMLKGKSYEQYIPPHLPVEQLANLPSSTGVYYFYNGQGKVIYVGKAKNLNKRVKSHFSNNKVNRQKQDFLRETWRISYKECATELMAHILESTEIRKLWPVYNRSQRGYLPKYGLYVYEDREGYKRLAIEKLKPTVVPVYSFNTITEGHNTLRGLLKEFKLCIRLCNLAKTTDCGCDEHLPIEEYNIQVDEAIAWLKRKLPTFAIIDKGLKEYQHSCILVREGVFQGMGYLSEARAQIKDPAQLSQYLEPMQDNDYIRNLVYKHAADYPEKCIMF